MWIVCMLVALIGHTGKQAAAGRQEKVSGGDVDGRTDAARLAALPVHPSISSAPNRTDSLAVPLSPVCVCRSPPPSVSVSGESCAPLPVTSACSAFFSSGTAVALPPGFPCQIDVERSFFGSTAQTLWAIVDVMQPNSRVDHNTQQTQAHAHSRTGGGLAVEVTPDSLPHITSMHSCLSTCVCFSVRRMWLV